MMCFHIHILRKASKLLLGGSDRSKRLDRLEGAFFRILRHSKCFFVVVYRMSVRDDGKSVTENIWLLSVNISCAVMGVLVVES